MSPRRQALNSLELLFELYEQKMYRIAFAILRDAGQAEDAVMAAFEKIIRQVGVPDDPFSDQAKRLAGTVVRSCAIDQYRKNARERGITVLAQDADALAPAAQPTCDPVAERLEHQAVADMVGSLDDPYQDVVRERFFNDHTVRETADELGISEANVRKRQQRALDMLRNRTEAMAL